MFTVQAIHPPPGGGAGGGGTHQITQQHQTIQIQQQTTQLQTIQVVQQHLMATPPQPQQPQPQPQPSQPQQQTGIVQKVKKQKSAGADKGAGAVKKQRKEKVIKKVPKVKKEKITKRKTTREIIDKQGRGIVFNVYMFLKAMHMRQQCQQPVKFAKTQELTAQACGIGKRTVQRIIKEGRISLETNEQPVFESPVKTRTTPSNTTIATNNNGITTMKRDKINRLDDMDCFILRRTVHEFYDQKQFPTVKQLLPVITNKINFQGSCNALRKILKDLGFSYRKAPDGRKFLMERADIVAARVKFLRTMHELRKTDQRTIYYVGESSVDPNYTLSLTNLTQNNNKEQKKLKQEPQGSNSIVICHVGSSKTGFLSQCKLVFQPKTKNPETGQINEMNTHVFKSWFVKVLHNLQEPSIIVMDNSQHHSRLLDLVPGAGSRKADIVEWLWRYGVSHDTKQTRAELLSLVKLHQPKSKSYELDTIAQEKGHTVVRLPPYHNQYNPIEMVWAQVKSEVAERNITCQVADVEQLVNHVLDQTSREVWEQSVQHAEQLQENDFKKELYRDQHLESFVINLQSDSESDDEHHDDYYSDDDHDQHDGDSLTVHHDQHTLITGDTSTLHHDNNDKNLFS
ncbi:uncharacterized protein LOC123290782 [Chrysoperla carnea]|uniref:uncharacterized protein LOC123290782 n=1 Tax=Chrysoperla carnea TaxID=189513 RepID=UPI001D073105|nr:uncharacterized protein LOC123290782 [Chrysoperla carnea]